MPEVGDNRVPSAHGDQPDPRSDSALNYLNRASRKKGKGPTAFHPLPASQGRRQANAAPARAVEPGLFSGLDWRWQVAGLVASVSVGIILMMYLFMAPCGGSALLFLLGLTLTCLAIYCIAKTNWLRQARTASTAVKAGTGTCIICGLVPLFGSIACAVAGVAMAVLIIGGFCAFIGGAGSGK